MAFFALDALVAVDYKKPQVEIRAALDDKAQKQETALLLQNKSDLAEFSDEVITVNGIEIGLVFKENRLQTLKDQLNPNNIEGDPIDPESPKFKPIIDKIVAIYIKNGDAISKFSDESAAYLETLMNSGQITEDEAFDLLDVTDRFTKLKIAEKEARLANLENELAQSQKNLADSQTALRQIQDISRGGTGRVYTIQSPK